MILQFPQIGYIYNVWVIFGGCRVGVQNKKVSVQNTWSLYSPVLDPTGAVSTRVACMPTLFAVCLYFFSIPYNLLRQYPARPDAFP